MVSLLNLVYISITLPQAVSTVGSILWGNGAWVLDGETLTKVGLFGLEADILVLYI